MDATELFRAALRDLTESSVESVAREAGYSRSAFDTYLNRRPPSRAAVEALVDALERHGEQLHEHAERLRETLRDEAEG